MRMGDTILFRGRRRLLIRVASGWLQIQKLVPNRFGRWVAHYNVTSAELRTIRVVAKGSKSTRARARRMLRAELPAHARIEWDGDTPRYVHIVNGIEHRI